MKITALGPFSATTDGVPIAPTAAKPRQILALLAVHAGQVVPVASVIEEVWGAAASPKAHITVQTYVLQLRTSLGRALGDPAAAREVLVTRPGGYALLTGPEDVDVHVYDRLCADAQTALEQGDDIGAAHLFRTALALWSGPAFGGLRPGAVLGLEAMRLEQSRAGVLERCLATELRLGAHERLLPELAELTTRHPHDEALHALFMTALDRSGHPQGALAVYETVRTRLDEEFGLLPSPDLRRLEREVRTRAAATAPA
ncbi:BTAD domain-containing putative transcriptional regulator [Streptomyces sp. NPDC002888]|uniref:AfsR/SARP family transcriptional regulator n=1 Tax=Streptomyces sp. NPDC002888 TaxID=3364668 RepID=UPI0036B7A98E